MIGLGSDKKREKSILIGFAKNSKSESQFKFWCSKNVKSQLFSVYVLGFLAAAENIDLANSSNILSGSSSQVHQQRTIMISKDETRTGFKSRFRWRGSFPITSLLSYYSLNYFCVSANQCVPIKQNKDSCRLNLCAPPYPAD